MGGSSKPKKPKAQTASTQWVVNPNPSMPMYSGGSPTPATPYGTPAAPTPNIFTAAQQGITGAGMATAGSLGTPLQQANIAAYQNPYTQQVINAQQADLMRGAQMGLNELGRQASQAGAFGGSRHGVAMSELGRGVADVMGQQAAALRQAGFQQAQQAAQQDIQTNLAAASQLANIANLGFGMGQSVQQGLAQQGAMQQGLQQALIDAAKAQYAGYTGAPQASIGYVSQALGATPVPQSSTTSKQPGLFDWLTLALG